MIALAPGPLALLDRDELVASIPEPALEALVAERLSDLAGVDVALAQRAGDMALDLAAFVSLPLDVALGAAAASHASQAAAPAPNFGADAAAAEAGLSDVRRLAGLFPPDDSHYTMPSLPSDGGDGFDTTPTPPPAPPAGAPPSGSDDDAGSGPGPADPFADGVRALYAEFLDRVPDLSEIDSHRGNPGGLDGVRQTILSSDEYAARVAG